MIIAFFSTSDSERKYLEKYFPEHHCIFIKEPLNLNNVSRVSDASIISIFIDSEVSGEILLKLPNVKLLATRSTGYDHIDMEAASMRSVCVSNIPSYGKETVAEFTFALILEVSRKVADAYYALRQNGSAHPKNFEGFELYGKTLGVIGTGSIGKHVIQIAKGFGMNVIAYDINPDEKYARTMGYFYNTIQNILKESDILTLHVPYNKHTRHLINEKNIIQMKHSAYLINTSRGGVVETDALVKALFEKRLAGAGLDVLEEEDALTEETALLTIDHDNAKTMQTILQGHALIDMPQVVVTPHIAFNSREAKKEILQTTVENIKRFIAGSPQHVIHEK